MGPGMTGEVPMAGDAARAPDGPRFRHPGSARRDGRLDSCRAAARGSPEIR